MKKVLLVLLAASFVIGCSSSSEKEMTLTGKIEGLKKGTVFLQKIEGDSVLVSVDSVEISKDETFSFSEKIMEPEVYYLHIRLNNGNPLDDRLAFFAEPSEININSDLENFAVNAVISGSENQKAWEEYKKTAQRFSDRHLTLIEELFNARKQRNDSLVQLFQNRQNSNLTGKYLATVNFAFNHEDLELSPYLMLNEVYNANIKYLDTVYKALTPQVKESMYGVKLANYIEERKANGL